jgi:hypothetical protein
MLTFAVPESLGSLLEMDNGGPSRRLESGALLVVGLLKVRCARAGMRQRIHWPLSTSPPKLAAYFQRLPSYGICLA